jgi:hypothetical protein
MYSDTRKSRRQIESTGEFGKDTRETPIQPAGARQVFVALACLYLSLLCYLLLLKRE